MIKEGAHTYIDGRGQIEPFRGKYAVMSPEVFDDIRSGWERAGLPKSPYRPLRVEFEITDGCNDSCKTCGMGAVPMREGVTLTEVQLARLVEQFQDVALPSVAITGGEPFMVPKRLRGFMRMARGTVDIGKLTTNGVWGSEGLCERTFERLVDAGLLDNRYFVPLLMVSIGEQTTPVDRVARIIRFAVTQFTDRQLNIAVSSLADPTSREHKVYDLFRVYEEAYGEFPHDRVHSTMRVYLENERLGNQAPVNRPGNTPVTKWMTHCYECFSPTVGTYVLPTALCKVNGDMYACAAFNVPEKLRFGNIFQETFREILARANTSAYVAKIREGGGLSGLHDVIPREKTDAMTCGSFCGSCSLLIEEFERKKGRSEPGGRPAAPVIPASALRTRLETHS